MPTLDFSGKQFIYSHHLTVPFRTLEVDATKSLQNAHFEGGGVNQSSLEDNLIIHGDNLHALKALLPKYAGKIKCVYIDPPYNTGNEGWVYNDNVNSPLMQRWLAGNSPIDVEDLERHDKWLCMMWPRLHLLRELLADDGMIFISIDDNEVHHLRTIMDEIFGEAQFAAEFFWMRTASPANLSRIVRRKMEPLICYQKSADTRLRLFAGFTDGGDMPLLNEANTVRTLEFPKEAFSIVNLTDGIYQPGTYARIRLVKAVEVKNGKFLANPVIEGRFKWVQETLTREAKIGTKFLIKSAKFAVRYEREHSERVKTPANLITQKECQVGTNNDATKELSAILGRGTFEYPKPTTLIKYLINMVCDENDIILDSFAGSGTTAHAVLALNREDGGNRKFILIECEDYADNITAERVRRVINGVDIARDEALRRGLGGSFAYCELGEPIDEEGMLSGETLPAYETLANYIAYVATGSALDVVTLREDFFFGETEAICFYLIYEPNLEFLESDAAALDGKRAARIAAHCKTAGKKAFVYAAHKFISQKDLTPMGITFCQLPYGIHQIADA